MSLALKKQDYVKILNYYNEPIPKTMKNIRKKAKSILTTKLCRCIKKVSPKEEENGIGICTKTIFSRKNLTRGSFKCDKKRGSLVTLNLKTRRNKKKNKITKKRNRS